MPIERINRRKILFLETGRHILNDAAPSAFLNGARKRPEFGEYPFELLLRMRSTMQPPQHHPEGSVWNHTLMVVDEAAKVKCRSKDMSVFMWAALLHDIGKPPTTKVRNGRITSYDHDKAGEELAKGFLSEFVEDCGFIERVTSLIRYHMQILYVGKGLPYADVAGMKERTDVGEVALLGLCDRLGRLGADKEEEEENIREFLRKVNLLNHPRPNGTLSSAPPPS